MMKTLFTGLVVLLAVSVIVSVITPEPDWSRGALVFKIGLVCLALYAAYLLLKKIVEWGQSIHLMDRLLKLLALTGFVVVVWCINRLGVPLIRILQVIGIIAASGAAYYLLSNLFGWLAAHKDSVLKAAAFTLYVVTTVVSYRLGLSWMWALIFAGAVVWGCWLFAKDKLNGWNNFLVTLTNPDGRLENRYIHREGDNKVWYTTYDKKGDVLATHPVAESKGSGLAATDYGTEKTHLFFWDGNDGKGSTQWALLPPAYSTAPGVPKEAEDIEDVEFEKPNDKK